jgi:4-hydroxy-4-methyl-2-oxoglutarate aldolase
MNDVLLEAGTAVVADVLDSLNVLPGVLAPAIGAVTSATRFVGPAYTIVGESHRSATTGDKAKLSAIDAMPPGVVPIWAGGDISGVCCFGDLLGEAMKLRGSVGAVVDGGVRDVSYLETVGLPIRARYLSPAQAIGRWRVTACQEPVQVRGGLAEWVTVQPGDTVISDEDGVIVVSASDIDRVCAGVAAWSSTETESREAIRNGSTLLAALEQFGHL